MGREQALNLTLVPPETESGSRSLAREAAAIHAEGILRRARDLEIPAERLDSIVNTLLPEQARGRT